MARPDSQVGTSCRISVANTPTCSTSVLEKATPTMKLRCFIATSRHAVAPSWQAAPSISQSR